MRAEVYSCFTSPVCSKVTARGVENGALENLQLYASSMLDTAHNPSLGRLKAPISWIASKLDQSPWFKVDLTALTVVTGIATTGANKKWVTSYTLSHSTNGAEWLPYKEYALGSKTQKERVFQANTDEKSVVMNAVSAFTAWWVELRITGHHGAPAMGVEVYGCFAPTACSRNAPLGVEKALPNTALTAKSFESVRTAPSLGRLHNKFNGGLMENVWIAKEQSKDEWFQVDLGMASTVVAVATQGRNHPRGEPLWLKKYLLKYATYSEWQDYLTQDGKPEIFKGNFNDDTVIKNTLWSAISARYVRFYPVAWHNRIGGRFELYGCRNAERGVRAEYWTKVEGKNLVDFTGSRRIEQPPFKDTVLRDFFETPFKPDYLGTNYGVRLQGYFVAPVSGAYRFFISGYLCSLSMSTTSLPSDSKQIASVDKPVPHRNFYKESTQASAPLNLLANAYYYLQAMCKQGDTADTVAVAVQLPNKEMQKPVLGQFLLTDVPNPASVYCDDQFEGGSWALVRRVPRGSNWHPATDHGTGEVAYGNYVADPAADATFSLRYSDVDYSEVMFSTGDLTRWAIMDKSEIRWQGSEQVRAYIQKSFENERKYDVELRNLKSEIWISAQDYNQAHKDGAMLYGEAGLSENSKWLREDRGGMNVWVRSATLCPRATTEEDASATKGDLGWCSTDKVFNGNWGMCKPRTFQLPPVFKHTEDGHVSNKGEFHVHCKPKEVLVGGGVANHRLKFDKKTIYQASMPEKQNTEEGTIRDGWRCKTGNGRGDATCRVQCCTIDEVPTKLSRGEIVDKCGKWRRTKCHANNSMAVVEQKCKGRAMCTLKAQDELFNKTTGCNNELGSALSSDPAGKNKTTAKKSTNFLVATGLCKSGLAAEKCVGGADTCVETCLHEVEEKTNCKRKFKMVKVQADQNNAGGYVKEEFGEPVCTMKKVCKKFGKKCTKDWTKMIHKCVKYMAPPKGPKKGERGKCESFVYMEPDSEDFWQSKQNIKMEKEFHVHRARIKLDAEFPQGGPTITKEFFHKIQVETSSPACAIPFMFKGRKFWDCIPHGSGYKWCGLDRDYKGRWGMCAEKTKFYPSQPEVGCISIRINGKTVADVVPLKDEYNFVTKFEPGMTPDGRPKFAQCPDAKWHCSNNPQKPGCTRTCSNSYVQKVKPPMGAGDKATKAKKVADWHCDKVNGFKPDGDWVCKGQGPTALCTRTCKADLADTFIASGQCKFGYFFRSDAKWQCHEGSGTCSRKCEEHFRQWKYDIPVRAYTFLKDGVNKVDFLYKKCNPWQKPARIKVLGAALMVELAAMNAYASITKGKGIIKNMEKVDVVKELTAEMWLYLKKDDPNQGPLLTRRSISGGGAVSKSMRKYETPFMGPQIDPVKLEAIMTGPKGAKMLCKTGSQLTTRRNRWSQAAKCEPGWATVGWGGAKLKMGAIRHLGCFKDVNTSRALPKLIQNDTEKMTVEICNHACLKQGYRYAGLQNGGSCFCGDLGYNKYGQADDALCNVKCPGQLSENCGGQLHNNVYMVGDTHFDGLNCKGEGCKTWCWGDSCEISPRCCRVPGTAFQCKTGPEVESRAGKWGPYSKCPAGMAVMGIASFEMLGTDIAQYKSKRYLKAWQCSHSQGGCRAKCLGDGCKVTTKCCNTESELTNMKCVAGQAMTAIPGPWSEFSTCPKHHTPTGLLDLASAAGENGAKSGHGLRAFECGREGCRVRCFGSECRFRANCCKPWSNAKPPAISGVPHTKCSAAGELGEVQSGQDDTWGAEVGDKATRNTILKLEPSHTASKTSILGETADSMCQGHPALAGCTERVKHVIENEGEKATLHCDEGTVIGKITFASFGYPQKKVKGSCTSKFKITEWCHQPITDSVISHRCRGLKDCEVEATRDVFGDPCANVVKRLAVSYTCVVVRRWVDAPSTKEGASGTMLRCPKGQQISKIEYSAFGLSYAKTFYISKNMRCSGYYKLVSMNTKDQASCQASCTSDPACRGFTFQSDGKRACYLYDAAPAEEGYQSIHALSSGQSYTPQKNKLQCGFEPHYTTGFVTSFEADKRCKSVTAQEEVAKLCMGVNQCELPVSDQDYQGDAFLCQSKSKRLTVQVVCSPGQATESSLLFMTMNGDVDIQGSKSRTQLTTHGAFTVCRSDEDCSDPMGEKDNWVDYVQSMHKNKIVRASYGYSAMASIGPGEMGHVTFKPKTGKAENIAKLYGGTMQVGMVPHLQRILNKRSTHRSLEISPNVPQPPAEDKAYMGCFADKEASPDVNEKPVIFDGTNSPGLCQNHCKKHNYKYAAVTRGKFCACGDSYGKHGRASKGACSSICPGAKKSKCGGKKSNGIYYTTLRTSKQNEHIGCFKDGSDGASFPYAYKANPGEENMRMTVGLCWAHCRGKKYQYAALRKGKECRCMKNTQKQTRVNNHKCDFPCSGTPTEMCGGYDTNDIFDTGTPKYEVVSDLSESIHVEEDNTLLIMQAHGTMNGNDSPLTKNILSFRINNEPATTEIGRGDYGEYGSSMGTGVGHVNFVQMAMVGKGHHAVSLQSQVTGLAPQFGFSLEMGKKCKGQYAVHFQGDFNPSRCANACRQDVKCNSWSLERDGTKDCKLFHVVDPVCQDSYGNLLGVRAGRVAMCARASEGKKLKLTCPAGQLITQIPFASYGEPVEAGVSFAIMNRPPDKGISEYLASGQTYTGDFNGDGKTDFVIVGAVHAAEDGQGPVPHFPVVLSEGKGFYNVKLQPLRWEPIAKFAASDGAQHFVGDFNGDGNSDIGIIAPFKEKLTKAEKAGREGIMLALGDNDGKWKIRNNPLHIGRSCGAEETPAADFVQRWTSARGAHVVTGDFNGDGKTDFAVTSLKGKWIGCFFENPATPDLDFEMKNADASDMDAFKCVDICKAKGYEFAGVQWHHTKDVPMCSCGNKHGKHGKAPEDECEHPCPKDKTLFCGDKLRNAIYTTKWSSLPVALSHGDGYFTVIDHPINVDKLPPCVVQREAAAAHKEKAKEIKSKEKKAKAKEAKAQEAAKPAELGESSGNPKPPSNSLLFTQEWAVSPGIQVVAADFNKDKSDDIVLVPGPSSHLNWTFLPVAQSRGDGSFKVFNKTLEGEFKGEFIKVCQQKGVKPFVGDFNGDGKMDIALVGSKELNCIPVALSMGDGGWFTECHKATSPESKKFFALINMEGVRVTAGDFNGDGLTDIAISSGKEWVKLDQNSIFIALAVSEGNNHGDFRFIKTNGGAATAIARKDKTALVLAGDFDGNGKWDLAFIAKNPTQKEIGTALSGCTNKMMASTSHAPTSDAKIDATCFNKPGCTITANKAFFGSDAIQKLHPKLGKKVKSALISVICSSIWKPPKGWTYSHPAIQVAVKPSARLITVNPKLPDDAAATVSGSRYACLQGYTAKFAAKQLSTIIVVFNAQATVGKDLDKSYMELAFFVDGKPMTGNGEDWNTYRAYASVARTETTSVHYKATMLVPEGDHTIKLMGRSEPLGMWQVTGGSMQVAVVPVELGREQFALYTAAKKGFQINFANGDTHSIAAPNLPLNRWFHYAASFDGFAMKLWVDGVEKAFKKIGGVGIEASSPLYPMIIGDDGKQRQITVLIDELRFWHRARSSWETINDMFKSVNEDEYLSLDISYDFKQAEFNTDLVDIKDKSMAARVLELAQPNMHKCQLTPIAGCKGPRESCTTSTCTGKKLFGRQITNHEHTWKMCPGADGKDDPAICSLAGKCTLLKRGTAGYCKCRPGFFGRDCSVGCPNAGNEGGPCFEHWGRGLCEKGTCKCFPGYVGADCRYPCPGMPRKGSADGGSKMTAVGPCFKRGQCKLEAGANDASCECANKNNLNSNPDFKQMNRDPKQCHYAGEACEVACPMFNGKVCGGRGHDNPMHPASGRVIKHFQGCLWETANEAELLTHFTGDSAAHGGTHGVATECGTAKKALCECDREGGFHGEEESCRVKCPGAGWPDGAKGGGRNVCGGGVQILQSMGPNIASGWPGGNNYFHSRGHCHINFYLGHQRTVNMKHALCDCHVDWKGHAVDSNIKSLYEVSLYKDTCSTSVGDKMNGGPFSFFREDSSCIVEGGTSQPLGTYPNCCPFGGSLKGQFDQGHGSYFEGTSAQCLVKPPPFKPPVELGSSIGAKKDDESTIVVTPIGKSSL